jgi:putative Mg2+ transporter-C (MgtC) family protein
LRRDGFVLGVTTAATLWFVTVIGLCFGGGQIGLGIASSALGILILSGLRWFDYRMKQEQHGILSMTTERDEPRTETVRAVLQKAGYKIISVSAITCDKETQKRDLEFKVQWRAAPHNVQAPAFLNDLLSDPHVATAQWKVS